MSHDESHIDMPPPPKERRFKLSRACDRCRRRRIKCDEGHPCQSCLSSHSPCTFEEPGKRTQHSKSKRTATLEDRMHHLETLIQSIPTNIFEVAARAHASSLDPHALTLGPTSYPTAVPPPSLTMSALTNPSMHFPPSSRSMSFNAAFDRAHIPAQSYMYWDEQGCKRWQGESSGLPLLDLLFDRAVAPGTSTSASATPEAADSPSASDQHNNHPSDEHSSPQSAESEWFPDRPPPRDESVHPETLWRVITSVIPPDLMDTLVQCYLSTSYYLMPFLHVPTFLADYSNPHRWGEPGFASFILAICLLASRHVDDPRVPPESDANDIGARWFALFNRLRTLPAADRPTLYTVQAVLVAAVYAVGRGRLSRAFALLAEAVTLSFDAGLHRSTEAYESFDRVEEQVRARTWWCVYLWDKQAAAAFGRPVLARIRDCDVGEPWVVDDEFITSDADSEEAKQPENVPSRMGAFVATLRAYIVLESVLDRPPSAPAQESSFLARARGILSPPQTDPLAVAESLLDDLRVSLPPHWAHTSDTLASDDVVRVTQAVRIHCVERFVRLLVWRARWTACLGSGGENEREAVRSCVSLARELVGAYLRTARKGVMTYYGVHVIHQLTQAGRTLVAVLLALSSSYHILGKEDMPETTNTVDPELQPLIAPSLEALRSCVSLLRRFSGRYVCGMRNGDLLEEFCRLSNIPLGSSSFSTSSAHAPGSSSTAGSPASTAASAGPSTPATTRPPWLRPVKKRPRSHTNASYSQQNGQPSSHQTSRDDDPFWSGTASPGGSVDEHHTHPHGHLPTNPSQSQHPSNGFIDVDMRFAPPSSASHPHSPTVLHFGPPDMYATHDLVSSLLQGGYGEDVFAAMEMDNMAGPGSAIDMGIDWSGGMFAVPPASGMVGVCGSPS